MPNLSTTLPPTTTTPDPYELQPTCGVCRDIRFVTTRETTRRYLGGNSPSEVFPCPACGPFSFDGDGKRYGVPGRRYGNPLVTSEYDYWQWRARNAKKATGWQNLPTFPSEQSTEKRLRELYPAADRRWVRLWVLGQREVVPEIGAAP